MKPHHFGVGGMVVGGMTNKEVSINSQRNRDYQTRFANGRAKTHTYSVAESETLC